ncbi:MAG: hypothetical protein SFT94_08150 [Pseudanabaenaceae cyanobacterium bins.68]|nr:hypothetical protein [Pseudanabaenaceae cyanobacterium bins.68]
MVNVFSFGLWAATLGLAAFGLLQWLKLPTGNITDWIVGVAIFAWLLAIATIPWNIHFGAREVLLEAEVSSEQGMPLDQRKLAYVRLLAKRSLIGAIALHLISAVSFYALAASGYTNLGYGAAIAALLLTFFRPLVRAYRFWLTRLESIRQQFLYPREDVISLRQRVQDLEDKTRELHQILDLEDQLSWAAEQIRQRDDLRDRLYRLEASLEELRALNAQEHERLAREAKQLVSQLSTDGQFLDHVREIIRFFKSA